MVDKREPSSPDQVAANPPDFVAQRPLEQFIATTLSEIQQELGRIRGDVSTLSGKIDKVGGDVGSLKDDYNFFKGAAAAIKWMWPAVAALMAAGFGIVWWSLSERIDRLKVLTEPPVTSAPQPTAPAPTAPAAPPRR